MRSPYTHTLKDTSQKALLPIGHRIPVTVCLDQGLSLLAVPAKLQARLKYCSSEKLQAEQANLGCMQGRRGLGAPSGERRVIPGQQLGPVGLRLRQCAPPLLSGLFAACALSAYIMCSGSTC